MGAISTPIDHSIDKILRYKHVIKAMSLKNPFNIETMSLQYRFDVWCWKIHVDMRSLQYSYNNDISIVIMFTCDVDDIIESVSFIQQQNSSMLTYMYLGQY